MTLCTTALHDLVNMGLYLALFMIGAGILSFWILPGLITSLAPVGHREVIRTTRRLGVLSASSSYYQSPLALFMPSDRAARFMTRGQILAMPNLRIGVFDDPVLRPALARLFPRAEIVVVPDYTTLPDFTKIDAAIWTLEQAGAIARSHPGITAVVPKDVGNPFLLTYLMPPHSDEMVHFVSYWLDLRKADGMRAREVSYWLLGQPRTLASPRWSVVRDVLHWNF